MSANKRHSEGCGSPVATSKYRRYFEAPTEPAGETFDPTAYEALSKIEQEAKAHAFRPMVYICSPLSGNIAANQKNARRYCRFAVDSGCIPLAPHLYFPQFMDDGDGAERDLALFMDLVLLSKCAELWVFGDHISKGMSIEIEKAKRKGQPIRWFTDDCKEVFDYA